jgi:CheY-like chemotaxis protein
MTPKKHILVIEDDKDQRQILQMLFTGRGYDLSFATQGQEALDLLKNQQCKPDLIVCDLMMPIMDGSEFTKIIKSDPDFKQIPLLILTVVEDEEREFELLDLGADDYCEKISQSKVILKRVERLINR